MQEIIAYGKVGNPLSKRPVLLVLFRLVANQGEVFIVSSLRTKESKGPLNQIRIKTASGDLVDLGEKSKIVAAIETFRLFRLYFADDDGKARTFIERLIDGEAEDGVGE
jgi:hypothetical protein